ncbi:MAG: hypothetical protein NT094_01450 [Candidatus Staskawiczbacteria bacterium]|nr:hypothetical protein [Candidatus Staskawiczbacteria bacterium]
MAIFNDEQLEKFRKIYKEKTGKDLTKAETLEKGISLISLMKTILLENQRQEDLKNNKK